MSEPTNEPLDDDHVEPAMTSGVADDVEASAAVDQWTTADLSDLDGVEMPS